MGTMGDGGEMRWEKWQISRTPMKSRSEKGVILMQIRELH